MNFLEYSFISTLSLFAKKARNIEKHLCRKCLPGDFTPWDYSVFVLFSPDTSELFFLVRSLFRAQAERAMRTHKYNTSTLRQVAKGPFFPSWAHGREKKNIRTDLFKPSYVISSITIMEMILNPQIVGQWQLRRALLFIYFILFRFSSPKKKRKKKDYINSLSFAFLCWHVWHNVLDGGGSSGSSSVDYSAARHQSWQDLAAGRPTAAPHSLLGGINVGQTRGVKKR